jgi:hypothetical protein
MSTDVTNPISQQQWDKEIDAALKTYLATSSLEHIVHDNDDNDTTISTTCSLPIITINKLTMKGPNAVSDTIIVLD